MKKFLLIGLPFQVLICFLIATCWFKWPYWEQAENLINFWGILCLVVAVLAIFSQQKTFQKKADDPEYELNTFRLYTVNFFTFIQVFVLVAMGWYWIGLGLALARIVFNVEFDAVKKLRKGKVNDAEARR